MLRASQTESELFNMTISRPTLGSNSAKVVHFKDPKLPTTDLVLG